MYIARYRIYSSRYTAAMPPFCDQAKGAHMGNGSPVNSMNHARHNASTHALKVALGAGDKSYAVLPI